MARRCTRRPAGPLGNHCAGGLGRDMGDLGGTGRNTGGTRGTVGRDGEPPQRTDFCCWTVHLGVDGERLVRRDGELQGELGVHVSFGFPMSFLGFPWFSYSLVFLGFP